MRRFLALLLPLTLVLPLALALQAQPRYTNPVLHMDYSDPDVCRVGEDYFMTASSFNCFPGLPILHSRDLVHWTLVGAALTDYEPEFHTSVQHGNGVWAPAIRYHDGWFYIFCGDPDRGIFMVKTQDPCGRWEDPVWVVRAKGFIDPCPLWDEDGRAWLSHAAAGSRAGLKSVLFMAPLAPDGTHLLGPSRIVYDGHLTQPTIEGTKLYQRDGWYYIFAPAGGVKTGWQTVLRAKHPYGPWEERIVMASAPGTINGPHQGAWVDTPTGENWFLHFQDKGAYGRIVHLQPMSWRPDGWPLIGEDPDADGIGQPVSSWPAPAVASAAPGASAAAGPGILADARQNLSDPVASARDRKNLSLHQANPPESRPLGPNGLPPESLPLGPNGLPLESRPLGPYGLPLESRALGPYGLPLEWQYPAVPSPYWHYALPDGGIRLYSVEQAQKSAPESPDWRQMKNLLLQKFPAERFTVVAKLVFHPNPQLGEKLESAGFLVSGDELAGFNLVSAKSGARLHYFVSRPEGDKVVDEVEEETAWIPYDKNREATFWIKLEVDPKYPSPKSPGVASIASSGVAAIASPDVAAIASSGVAANASSGVAANASSGVATIPVPDAICRFYFSLDGKRYAEAGVPFTARPEQWIGAKFGFFCNRYAPKNDAGWLDIYVSIL